MRGLSSFHGGHSEFGDGEGKVSEIARSAAVLGFVAFGFTEHFPSPAMNEFVPHGELAPPGTDPDGPDWVGDYVEAVQNSREHLAGRLSILVGAEVEFIGGAQAWTREQVARWPFDYLVGSVHYLRYDGEEICIDCGGARSAEALWRAGSAERLRLDYYDHVLELLSWRLVQIVGHLDLVDHFIPEADRGPTGAVRSKVESVLESMRDLGMGLDVNAGGLERPGRAINPAGWILESARRIGVAVTLGDDSHGPGEVGLGLEQAVASLQRAGYDSLWLVRSGGDLEPAPIPMA